VKTYNAVNPNRGQALITHAHPTMSSSLSNGKRRYDLEIDEEVHWHLVALGAINKMDHESFVEFMIEESVKACTKEEEIDKVTTDALLSPPLYKAIKYLIDANDCDRSAQSAAILNFIAEMVEKRGEQDLDLDPGETSDWLRREAQLARISDPENNQ